MKNFYPNIYYPNFKKPKLPKKNITTFQQKTHGTTNNINIEMKQRNNNHQRKLQTNPAQIDANYSQ